jgi:hypothetical protein
MAAGDHAREQIELVEVSLSALMVVFRGVVRLHGEIPPQDYVALSADVARRAGFSDEPFRKAIAHVRGTEKLSRENASAVLAGYMAGMEALVAWLDKFAA